MLIKVKRKYRLRFECVMGRRRAFLLIHTMESAGATGAAKAWSRSRAFTNEQTNRRIRRIGRDLVFARHAAGAGPDARRRRAGFRRGAQRCVRIHAARARAGGATHHRRAGTAPRGPEYARDGRVDVSYLRKRLSQFVGCTGFFLATM
jgi:hypothetical protein